MWNGMNFIPCLQRAPTFHFSREMIGMMRSLQDFPACRERVGMWLLWFNSHSSLRDTERSRLHELSQPKISGKSERRMVKLKPSCAAHLQCGWRTVGYHFLCYNVSSRSSDISGLQKRILTMWMSTVASTGQKNHPGSLSVCLVKAVCWITSYIWPLQNVFP